MEAARELGYRRNALARAVKLLAMLEEPEPSQQLREIWFPTELITRDSIAPAP